MGGLTASVETKHVYLAGAIEHAPDGGRAWRKELSTFIREHLQLAVFNPCEEEQALLSPEEKTSLRTWKCTAPEQFRTVIRRFVDNDLGHLRKSSFVVCFWDRYANQGAGTAGEVTLAYFLNIPVYLVTACPVAEVPGWVLACTTHIFADFETLKQFLLRTHAPGGSRGWRNKLIVTDG